MSSQLMVSDSGTLVLKIDLSKHPFLSWEAQSLQLWNNSKQNPQNMTFPLQVHTEGIIWSLLLNFFRIFMIFEGKYSS